MKLTKPFIDPRISMIGAFLAAAFAATRFPPELVVAQAAPDVADIVAASDHRHRPSRQHGAAGREAKVDAGAREIVDRPNPAGQIAGFDHRRQRRPSARTGRRSSP
jgi:hypothetical protein